MLKIKIKYGFLYILIITGMAVTFLLGYIAASNRTTLIPVNKHNKIPSVCRIFITPEGMINVSSPSGEVEVFSANQNTIIEELSNEEKN